MKYGLLHVEREAFMAGTVKPVGKRMSGKKVCMAHVNRLLRRSDWEYSSRVASADAVCEAALFKGLPYQDAVLLEYRKPKKHVLYECGICDQYHPWDFAGDCRDDANRYGSPEEYAEKKQIAVSEVEVREMNDRTDADLKGKAAPRADDFILMTRDLYEVMFGDEADEDAAAEDATASLSDSELAAGLRRITRG